MNVTNITRKPASRFKGATITLTETEASSLSNLFAILPCSLVKDSLTDRIYSALDRAPEDHNFGPDRVERDAMHEALRAYFTGRAL